MNAMTISDIERLIAKHRRQRAGLDDHGPRLLGDLMAESVAAVQAGVDRGREGAVIAWLRAVDTYCASEDDRHDEHFGWAFIFKPWASALVGHNAGPNYIEQGFDVLTNYWTGWRPLPRPVENDDALHGEPG